MEILRLNLSNFRNFKKLTILFDPKLAVVVGKNGAGKSNMLEAIALLSGIRPIRVETELDLIRFGQGEAKISGEVRNGMEKPTLTINFLVGETGRVAKSHFIDSIRKRLLDFAQLFAVVVFAPSDLDLVSGSPSLRRRFLDSRLSTVDRDYWRNISAYSKIVVRRNKVLQRIQEGRSKPIELNFWDERLLEHGSYISKARREFFEFLNFVSLDPGSVKEKKGKPHIFGDISWQLKQSELSQDKLLKNRERDIAAGITLSGPHRDDFRFMLRGYDMEFFGSRGEQRMAVLALKLSELEFYRIKFGQRPVLALDDIFSELDWEHREVILSVISNQQTIITAAEEESVPKEILKESKVIYI